MKIDVIMPKMGESIMEGTLIKWHKKKGDKVETDEIIFEISTDKVDTEIPSPATGVLTDIKVFEQETVAVDTVVALIETNGDGSKENKETEQKQLANDEPSTTQVGGEIIDIPMPKMGESIMEGTIIKWYKKPGEKIKKDEILFEISTDKVDTEVPSPDEGTVTEILHEENTTVDVGTTVARISKSGGLVKVQSKPSERKPEVDTKNEQVEQKIIKVESTRKSKVQNRFYSPLVNRIAQKENISASELESILGSGTGSRVTKNDILNYLSTRSDSYQKTSILSTSNEGKNGITVIPMDNIRQRIMHHMLNSRDTSVHVTGVMEVDMTKIHNFIQANKDSFLKKEQIKLTYMPFISYAAILGLKEYPLMNSSIEGKNILQKNFINLGIAVAVEPNGLLVPNIKNADEKSVVGLAKSISELGGKARKKGLTPDDITGGTFTLTNYGVFGSLFGTPIINQPEVGVLGIGAVVKKPVVIEHNGTESITIKPMMYLSLSHDHRLVDGLLGGMYLKFVKDSLENFDINLA